MFAEADGFPRRLFLDSSVLQTLLTYGAFLYEHERVPAADRLHRDPRGLAKLHSLKAVMEIAERAPFEFALSENSFIEVASRRDASYLRWAYDVLDHWTTCLEESGIGRDRAADIAKLSTPGYNYLGKGDRALIRDAIRFDCDTFLTMENRLPKNAEHLRRTLSLRVVSPVELWDTIKPWAALFR